MFPSTIREINALPEREKQAIYCTLIPDWVYADYGIDANDLTYNGFPVVQFRAREGTRAVEIIIKREAGDLDPMLYLNVADTYNHHIIVLLVVLNDPAAPRFNTDIDEYGNKTQFGTVSRNIYAEIAAMKYGLAPGQVRAGLRAFKSAVPIFEQFVSRMGRDSFLIEPLAYHNALIFERRGFDYLYGLKDMQRIHAEFQPGGDLHARLDGRSPFRQSDQWRTARGRSWAIHDGILGHPFTGFQMRKVVGVDAGINTFPDFAW